MGRLATYDRQELAALLRRQDGVIGRAQAAQCAMTDSALRHRIRLGGPWQVVLPGVYLAHTGPMTARQRDMAAFVYANRPGGEALAVSGAAALEYHGIPYGVPGSTGPRRPAGGPRGLGQPDRAVRLAASSQPGLVDVLVRPSSLRRDTGFVRLHRTSAELTAVFADGPLRYATPARAVADTARLLRDLSDIRAVAAACVQRGKAPLWLLADELARMPARGSAGLRQALAEVAEGVRSATESDLLVLIKRARLPVPLFNPRLYVGTEFLAMPDAYWPGAGLAAEADSREWHLSPQDWEQTLARHARMSAHGIIVLHYPPSRIRAAGREVAAEIRAALAAAGQREIPGLRICPTAADAARVAAAAR